MNKLSDHTRIMNILISFTKKIPEFPSYLREAGYSLEIIEPYFVNSEGSNVNPDIVFYSNNDLNVLVTECTEGHIDPETVEKYNKITPEELRDEVEGSVWDTNRISREIMYSGTSKTEQSYEIDDDVITIPNPGLIFDFDEEIVKRKGEFEDSELNEAIDKEVCPSNPPTWFYPFSPNDDRRAILPIICQNILHLASSGQPTEDLEFDAKELLEEALGKHWDSLSPHGKSELISRVEGILDDLREEDFEENLRKIKAEDTYYVKSCQAFQRKAEELIEEYREQETLNSF